MAYSFWPLTLRSPLKISKDPPQGGRGCSRVKKRVAKVVLPLLCFSIALLCDHAVNDIFRYQRLFKPEKSKNNDNIIPWPKVAEH